MTRCRGMIGSGRCGLDDGHAGEHQIVVKMTEVQSLPSGVGDAQTRHLYEENCKLRARVAELEKQEGEYEAECAALRECIRDLKGG